MGSTHFYFFAHSESTLEDPEKSVEREGMSESVDRVIIMVPFIQAAVRPF